MSKRIVKDGKHICAGFEVETENGGIVRIWAGENNAACTIYKRVPHGYSSRMGITLDAFRTGYNRGVYVVKTKGEPPMKTGIEHIFERFDRMADLTRGYLNKPHELNLYVAINTINYLDGLAFAATMAHKECESDADLAAAMCDDANFLRDWYNKICLTK